LSSLCPKITDMHDSVKLSDLNWQDETFAIFSFVDLCRLHDSLQLLGMLCHPWVWAKADGSKIIVDGFKRLDWARREGLNSIECMVFPPGYDPAKLMIERIELKLFESSLNTAEKAQIVSKLDHSCSRETVLNTYLPRLGVAPRAGAVEGWKQLADSSRELLVATALDEISERAALELSGWEQQSQTKMVATLRELRCSASIQWEILERVKEISVREEIEQLQVLSDRGIVDILRDSNKNHREKTQLLRAWLYRRRYPRVRAREERFVRNLTRMNLPNNLRFLPPPSFEGRNWQLQLSFTSPDELLEVLEKLRNPVLSAQFTKLMHG